MTDFGRKFYVFAFFCVFAVAAFSTNVLAYITPHQYYDPVRHLLVNMADTRWDLSAASDLSNKISTMEDGLQFVARSPVVTQNGIQATLTMRVDRFNSTGAGEWSTARRYAERWLRDFPKFGYDLEMSRDSVIGTLHGFDMEFKSKTNHRIARQFIVRRSNEMWIFTCSGDDQNFEREWPACEKILKTADAH